MEQSPRLDNQQRRLEWLGGFICGEGHISITAARRPRNYTYYMPVIHVSNTDAALIDRCARDLQGYGFHRGTRIRQKAEWKNLHYLEVVGHKRVKRLLPELIPHLEGVKRKQAELVLKFCGSRDGKQGQPITEQDRRLVEEVKSLSRRGSL